MLLSRAADGLYWICRYLERAEHAARVIDVAVDLGLGRNSELNGGAIERMYQSIGLSRAELEDDPGQVASVADAALFDLSNRNSVASCIGAARDNARQVREEISADMWEQINGLFLRLRHMREDESLAGRTHFVSRMVIEGVHLFQGITDATMGHGEGFQYLAAGRFLERASSTAWLLDAFLADTAEPSSMRPPLDQVEWVALLRSCSALEAYCRHYTADVRPERVAEFLLLSAEFPRSVRFAAGRLDAAVRTLARGAGRGAGGRAERLAGRLHASLNYGQVDEILTDGPHAYLTGVVRQCGLVHAALQQTYIAYPIESALPA